MFCEKVYDINSNMYKFMEENELIDQDEKELLKEFSKSQDDFINKNKKNDENKQFKTLMNIIQDRFLCKNSLKTSYKFRKRHQIFVQKNSYFY